jgi:hypothetical protein
VSPVRTTLCEVTKVGSETFEPKLLGEVPKSTREFEALSVIQVMVAVEPAGVAVTAEMTGGVVSEGVKLFGEAGGAGDVALLP